MINLNNELISSLNDFRPKFDSEGKAANIYQLYKNIHIINPDLPELKFNLTTKGNKSAKNRIIASGSAEAQREDPFLYGGDESEATQLS